MNIVVVISGILPGLFYKEILKISTNLRYFLWESINWPERKFFLIFGEISIFFIEIIFLLTVFLTPFLIFIIFFERFLKFSENPQYYLLVPCGYLVFLISGILIRRKIL